MLRHREPLLMAAITALICLVGASAIYLRAGSGRGVRSASVSHIGAQIPASSPTPTTSAVTTLPAPSPTPLPPWGPYGWPTNVSTWTPGEPEPDMHFSTPSSPPEISREEAIKAAEEAWFTPKKYVRISARYVLMTKDDPEDWKSNLEHAGLLDRHPDGWKDLPVWIVSFEGVHIPTNTWVIRGKGRNAVRVPNYHRELNIIISAENGKYLEAYAFR